MAAAVRSPAVLRGPTLAGAAVAAPLGRRGIAEALPTDEVRLELLFDIGPGPARLTLCRPKKLNSLSLDMIKDLMECYAVLDEEDASCVILSGEGRALCAGGDVAEMRESVLAGTRHAADFFYEEYVLDYQIATLHEREGIVQVSLWDGIVMGGGVGLSVHSPIRIATEKTMFAMPETAIGLFPDVGMSWALSRLKAGPHVGIYLGLTGQRLGAADCLASGLATHFVPSERLAKLEECLRALGSNAGDLEAVSAAVAELGGGAVPERKGILEPNAKAIEHCFGGDPSAEEILERLEAEAGHWLFQPKADDGFNWAADTSAKLRKHSPTSIKVSLEAIRRHRATTLKEAFVMEYRLSQWCMRPQPHSDFCEGIRAVLVDKDNAPKWEPSRIEDVSQERVEEFFQPLGSDHPRGELKL